jgi:predicted 3-demethylubiquinone-9 3-methyltransferase (glyoxalase superfamily)
MDRITPCLWFDTEGEMAANFYASVLPNSRIVEIEHYGEAGPRPAGTVMTVAFELNGQSFIALNGGPDFKFNEAISLQVDCKDQERSTNTGARSPIVERKALAAGLKDKYGLSWQIVPTRLFELFRDPDREKSQRVMEAMLKMKKIQVDELEQAAAA